MADAGESSSSPSSSKPMNEKPVVVRLKRKASQSRVDGLWLEITERPVKRPLLDFGKLSISDSTGKDELKTKKIFVQHVETVSNSEAAVDILHSFVPETSDTSGFRTKIEERRHTFKQENQKRDRLLSRAKQNHEVLEKNARFEQIWKSRKENKETVLDDSLREICHLYDVVRVETDEEASIEAEERVDTSLEDNTILCNYLPLIREFLPNAAAEIESDIQAYMSEQGASTDGYVYDLYTVNDNPDATDVSDAYPLVQVDDDDFYDGQSHSEYESDDSNAEDNPLNEYPDEETSEEDEVHSHSEAEDVESSASGNQSEHLSEDVDALYEKEVLDDDLDVIIHHEDDDDEDDEDWSSKYH
ncbi:RNA-directed DNA methylation 4 isoform X2 [Macadamia integrifolia]|nr:RNA-directed DNA methylation 4 isoform X2 [Macadamia integrifolia]XP_042513238.1 RNA-directed DNA methylation 4 isoform X2 [Macadamia integrifolia]XP_042513239.1 RNA-directed DNA methylation 4 isoform X2 [Macadamia integrifolia]